MSTQTHPLAGRSGGPPPLTPTGTATAPPPDPIITGIPAYGTLIQVLADAGPPEVYRTIMGVGDITGPANTMNDVETTSHSTGAPVRTKIPGLIDLGDLSFPCYWNPSDPTQNINSPFGLEFLFWNRIITKFQLVMTDETHRTRQFQGYVKQIGETYPVQGVCTRNTAITIASPPKDVASGILLEPDTAPATGAGDPAGTFDVKTGGALAPWVAVATVGWITVTGPLDESVGDETVTYTVAAQAPAGPARTGHISIAALKLSFTVDQAAGA